MRNVSYKLAAVTGYLWGTWPSPTYRPHLYAVSPLHKDIISLPYVDIEDAFLLAEGLAA
ncbi:hypothetical protein BJY52DRAFT_1196711 [Lactarius psammicola]|nr:hypothetical protein BJY52DRAFT_1196711 [Lactarius psammicola]